MHPTELPACRAWAATALEAHAADLADLADIADLAHLTDLTDLADLADCTFVARTAGALHAELDFAQLIHRVVQLGDRALELLELDVHLLRGGGRPLASRSALLRRHSTPRVQLAVRPPLDRSRILRLPSSERQVSIHLPLSPARDVFGADGGAVVPLPQSGALRHTAFHWILSPGVNKNR